MLQTSKVEENPPELQRKISVGDANIPNREKSFPFICHWDYPLRLNRHTLSLWIYKKSDWWVV